MSISEEPGAVISHAGIYAGGGRATALSTATVAVRKTSTQNISHDYYRIQTRVDSLPTQ